ncbi:hypothetical protein ACLKA6_002872 [Drosophila palustris]
MPTERPKLMASRLQDRAAKQVACNMRLLPKVLPGTSPGPTTTASKHSLSIPYVIEYSYHLNAYCACNLSSATCRKIYKDSDSDSDKDNNIVAQRQSDWDTFYGLALKRLMTFTRPT